MDLKKLRKLTFGAFILIVAFWIISGLASTILMRVGGFGILKVLGPILNVFKIVLNLGLLIAMVMNFIEIKKIEEANSNERLLIGGSMISCIIFIFVKIIFSVIATIIYRGGQIVNMGHYKGPVIMRMVESVFVFIPFALCFLLFLLSWVLYSKKREAAE